LNQSKYFDFKPFQCAKLVTFQSDQFLSQQKKSNYWADILEFEITAVSNQKNTIAEMVGDNIVSVHRHRETR